MSKTSSSWRAPLPSLPRSQLFAARPGATARRARATAFRWTSRRLDAVGCRSISSARSTAWAARSTSRR
ncbi:MAG: hypothetical protein B7Z73_16930, partial [Planctomycetia bacterium 21-64-5]